MNSHANAAAALMLDGNKIYYLRYVDGVLMRTRPSKSRETRRALAHTLIPMVAVRCKCGAALQPA